MSGDQVGKDLGKIVAETGRKSPSQTFCSRELLLASRMFKACLAAWCSYSPLSGGFQQLRVRAGGPKMRTKVLRRMNRKSARIYVSVGLLFHGPAAKKVH